MEEMPTSNAVPTSKELVAASSRPMVLSILAGGESYGYAILQQISAMSGGQLEWSEGMLYPVLHRLEKGGLISATWKKAETGRRRRYYSLTPEGKRQLSADRKSWMAVHHALTQTWAENNV